MPRHEHYGILKNIKEMVAEALTDKIMETKSRVGLLTIGHNRWQYIDEILLEEMGRNVKEYWEAQDQVYKSMIRRAIWERALGKVNERVAIGIQRSQKAKKRRSTSLESLLNSVEERA